jgi:hypothetical protein
MPPRIWFERSVERSSSTGRVSDKKDASAVGGEESFGGFVDGVIYTTRLINYQEHSGGVVALKTFRGVSGQSDGKPVWGYFKLRLEKFSKGGVNMSMTLSNFSPEQLFDL